LNTNRTICSQE